MFCLQDNGKVKNRGSLLFVLLLSKHGSKPNALFAKQDNGKVKNRGSPLFVLLLSRY